MAKKIEKLIEKLQRVQLRGNTTPGDLDALEEAADALRVLVDSSPADQHFGFQRECFRRFYVAR